LVPDSDVSCRYWTGEGKDRQGSEGTSVQGVHIKGKETAGFQGGMGKVCAKTGDDPQLEPCGE